MHTGSSSRLGKGERVAPLPIFVIAPIAHAMNEKHRCAAAFERGAQRVRVVEVEANPLAVGMNASCAFGIASRAPNAIPGLDQGRMEASAHEAGRAGQQHGRVVARPLVVRSFHVVSMGHHDRPGPRAKREVARAAESCVLGQHRQKLISVFFEL